MVYAGFTGFWRNTFVSISSIFVMTITLIMVGSVLVLDELLGAVLEQVAEKVDVNVYFAVEADEAGIFALKNEL